MKKKNLKNLNLNKKTVSNLKENNVKGGNILNDLTFDHTCDPGCIYIPSVTPDCGPTMDTRCGGHTQDFRCL